MRENRDAARLERRRAEDGLLIPVSEDRQDDG
jgi:hypothetical protein